MDEITRVLDSYQLAAKKRLDKAHLVQRQLGAVRSTARSEDGLITLTLGPNGAIADLILDDRCSELAINKLASLIVSTANRAQQVRNGQIKAIVEPLVGTKAARELVNAQPLMSEKDLAASPESLME